MTTSVIRHLRSFARCGLAVTLIGLMALVLPIATQTPQRANAAAMTGFTQVAVGTSFTCALKSDQTVWCWGLNSSGQLGDGTTTNRNRPVQVSGLTGVTAIDNQSDFACALKSDQTVWCWGNGGFGQLGNGATVNASTPVQASGLSGVVQISVGYGHGCAVLSDGTVRCWGWNVNQMLGNGTTVSSSTPIAVSGITTATQIRAGAWQNCVLLANQTLTCWGGGTGGFRGDGNATSASTKSSPTGISGVTMLSNAHGQHICVKLSDQSVKCWGYNDHGQVGDNTQVDKNSPVVIADLAGVIGISSANHTSCAIKADQTVLCWGWGSWNQLGNGSNADKFVPTAVPNVAGANQVSAGYTHTCVLLTDTSIQCWGRNQSGEIGNGITGPGQVYATAVLAPAVTLTAPSSIAVSATASTAKSLDVSWDAIAGASSYTVKLFDVAGTTTHATKTGVTGTSTTFNTSSFGSMANNTIYKVSVQAIGDSGVNYNNSVESAKVSGTTNLVAATPTISSQPAAVTRTYGQSATMSITASVSDGGTLSYQWLKGGVAVTGAINSSLVISSSEMTDAGSFSVIVTNTLANALSTAVTSNTAALTVGKATQSALTVSSTNGTYGSSITLTSSGGSGTGAVTFAVTSAGTAGCSITGGTTLAATTPGTCTVTATKATSANYLVETSSATTITFARQSQSALSVSTTNGDLYTGIILSIIGGSGSGTVTSSVSSGSANCSLTAGVVSARAVGTCALTVTKAADTYYSSETATVTLTFSKAVPTQGSLASPTSGTAGSGINLSFGGGSGTGAVSYTVSSPGGAECSISNGVLTALNAGKCIVTITRAGDDTYASQSTNVEFTFAGNPMSSVSSTTTTTVVRASGSSVTSTTSTTSTTTTVPKKQVVAPKLVNTESAAGAATIDGKIAKAKTSRVNNQLVFTASGFTLTLAGVNTDGTIIPLSSDGSLEVGRGDLFRFDAQGFAPNSTVNIWMFSKPILMGTIEVGSDGLVKSTLKVPKSVENGLHHLVMVGVDKNKKEAKFEVGMNVGVPPKQWWYSRILIVIPISIAVFLGFWLPTSASRRRRLRA
jgi:alpha-tubulin suppressor-like RCC1 family protein